MIITIDGIKTNYCRLGSGKKTVLFLHGWHQNYGFEKYQKLLNCLSKKFTVIALDLPGFGQTDLNPILWTVFDYADFVAKFITNLKLKSFTLTGHSFGGRLSLILSTHPLISPLVSNLILIDSAGIEIKSLKTKIILRLSRITPSSLKKLFSPFFSSSDYSTLSGIKKQSFSLVVSQDLSHLLPDINLPTLLLWGGLDRLTPLAHAHIFHQNIKNSKLVISESDNHGLPYRNHSFVCRQITKFLDHQ